MRKAMIMTRKENKKVSVGDLVRMRTSIFDLLKGQVGVVTEINGKEAIINLIGHGAPIVIPDIRDWLDVIEVLTYEPK